MATLCAAGIYQDTECPARLFFGKLFRLTHLQNLHYDICVVGGGPAGIAAAVKLYRLGFNTLLIDAGSQFNRPDVNSVSPAVLTLLSTIGLNTEQIEKCFTPIQHARIRWTGAEEETNQPSGFLIHRHIFDNELMNSAKQLGVQVMQPASVISCRHIHDYWELLVFQSGTYSILKTNFLVDATGKKSVLRGSKIRTGVQTIAITGSWKNTSRPEKTTWLESAPENWLWGAKISDDFLHVTVFTDPSALDGRSRLMRQYVSAIKGSILFRDCLQDSVAGELVAVEVTPYYYKHAAGGHFIKIGEACTGLDPLSSQGIQSAVANAIQGAIVVNTIFSKPDRQDIALEFYSARQQESIRDHLLIRSKSYSSALCWQDQPFWKNRTMKENISNRNIPTDAGWSSEMVIKLSPDVILQSVICIDADLVCRKIGLIHPGLDGPMVYWQNLEMRKLIESVAGSKTISDLIRAWSVFMPPPNAVQLMYTLRRAGVLNIIS
jgi:flavin-dependent dehydrogenase